jgi:hypothetical protein
MAKGDEKAVTAAAKSADKTLGLIDKQVAKADKLAASLLKDPGSGADDLVSALEALVDLVIDIKSDVKELKAATK